MKCLLSSIFKLFDCLCCLYLPDEAFVIIVLHEFSTLSVPCVLYCHSAQHQLFAACAMVMHLLLENYFCLRQQQHLAALWVTKQPFSGTALLASHGDRPRKAGLTLTWLASHGQLASLPSGKKKQKKKTASLSVACWNICTMQDFEDYPQ